MNVKNLKLTVLINLVSLIKIPLLAFARPVVLEIDDSKARVKINLGWRTKNHLGTMYFGSLAMGAELSIALKLVQFINEKRAPIEFIFKNFSSDFLKRADSNVIFVCEEAEKITMLAEQALLTNDRIEETFNGFAISEKEPEKILMKYRLTLSIKNRREVVK